ncbi:MAG: SDR family oxidoreductase [SAR324 cluster bacterium]|nr:SDR family oxidoreductase [SAR324 cluster bacterium]
MKNKICLITGATAGIGKETAMELASREATLVLACRNLAKGAAVCEEIKSTTGNERVEALPCDLSAFSSIRNFAEEFTKKYEQLHVLINNAGLFCSQRDTTDDGFEMTFGANHLGPFLLTHLLQDHIRKSTPARIINVSSRAHFRGKINFEDLQSEQGYNGISAYSNSKLANVLFTYELARRFPSEDVTVNCLHPGVVATDLWPTGTWYLALLIPVIKRFMISAKEGAETTIFLATAPELQSVTGKYFDKCSEKNSSSISRNPEIQRKLWELSEEMCQI